MAFNFPHMLEIKPFVPSDIADLNQDNPIFGSIAQEKAIQKHGIAGRIWEAAGLFNSYLLDSRSNAIEFDPPFLPSDCRASRPDYTIIELGSGTGVVSARLAHIASTRDLIIATDLPDVCSLLNTNLESLPSVLVRPLAWGNSQHVSDIASEVFSPNHPALNRTLTHLVCSDLVYFPELFAPLLRTILHLTSIQISTDENPQIIISYKVRSLVKEVPFWAAFGLWFSFYPVLVRDRNSSNWTRFGKTADGEDLMFLFFARRKPESHTWHVPANDGDLLAGVGALNSPTRKDDDAFETLLFMNLGEAAN